MAEVVAAIKASIGLLTSFQKVAIGVGASLIASKVKSPIAALLGGIAFGGIIGKFAGGAILGGAAIGALSVLPRFLAPKRTMPERKLYSKTITSEIVPARFVWGYQRLAGVMFWVYQEGERTLHMGILLSVNAIDGLEDLYVDDELVSLVETSAGVFKAENLTVYTYLAADGSGGATLRAVDSNFTADHRGEGISWVHVKLYQPDYGQDLDKRFWTSVPNLEFVIRGMKLTWPGQVRPAWTRNPAAIRYWIDTERKGIAPELIDRPAFDAAYALCNQDVNIVFPEALGYSAETKRYLCDGVIDSTTSIKEIEEQIDFCWSGWVIHMDGKLFYQPGADRPVSHVIDQTDIISMPELRPSGALQERVNSIASQLGQSRDHDWVSYSMGEIDDPSAIARDGQRRVRDIGELPFTVSAITAGRLLRIALRKLQLNATFRCVLKPGPDMDNLNIRPGRTVLFNNAEYGLKDFRCIVVSSFVGPDWSLTLDLNEISANLYDDAVELPVVVPRKIDIPKPQAVPAPTGLTVENEFQVARDGSVRWWIEVTWNDAQGLETQVWVKSGTKTLHKQRIYGNSLRFDIPTPGTYTISAIHLRRQGYGSEVVSVSHSFDWADVAPPRPQLWRGSQEGLQQRGSNAQFLFQPTVYRDLSAVELRYVRGPISGTGGLSHITESNWDSALQFSITWASPVTPNQPIKVIAEVPQDGRFRIFARYINSVGVYSDITEVGYLIFKAPRLSSVVYTQYPGWRGKRNNVQVWQHGDYELLPDQDTTRITRSAWNGGAHWPFGAAERSGQSFSSSGSAYYDTPVYEIGANIDGRINMETLVITDPPGGSGEVSTAEYWVFWRNSTFTSRSVPRLAALQSGVNGARQASGYTVSITNCEFIMFRLWLKTWRGRGITAWAPELEVTTTN